MSAIALVVPLVPLFKELFFCFTALLFGFNGLQSIYTKRLFDYMHTILPDESCIKQQQWYGIHDELFSFGIFMT